LITIDDVNSCMYCGVHVGAPGLLRKPSVIEDSGLSQVGLTHNVS
jgi:hypothetical protein